MYSIRCDGQLIYAPPVADDGYIAHSAKLTKEINLVDSLEFTIPPNGNGYDSINKMTSVITVYDGDEKIFHGRCINIERDFYKQKKFYCEGALGFLNDSVQRPYTITNTPGNIFKSYIDWHNTRVDASKRFIIGDISSMQTDSIYRESDLYPTTMNEVQDKLIENYGGYVMPRYVGDDIYIDYKATSGADNRQVIQFGENLLDMSEFVDASEVKTILIPLGATVQATGKKLTISSVNDGMDYLASSSGIALFGRIETAEGWDDITDASALKAAGQTRLAELITEATTLTLSAIDLSLLDVNADRIRLGEWNRVLSVPHEVDDYFQCSQMTLDLTDPRNNEYTFGNPRPTLTDSINRYKLS